MGWQVGTAGGHAGRNGWASRAWRLKGGVGLTCGHAGRGAARRGQNGGGTTIITDIDIEY